MAHDLLKSDLAKEGHGYEAATGGDVQPDTNRGSANLSEGGKSESSEISEREITNIKNWGNVYDEGSDYSAGPKSPAIRSQE